MEVRKFVQHVKEVAYGHFDNHMTALRLVLSSLPDIVTSMPSLSLTIFNKLFRATSHVQLKLNF